jgi:hypothetical protein
MSKPFHSVTAGHGPGHPRSFPLKARKKDADTQDSPRIDSGDGVTLER